MSWRRGRRKMPKKLKYLIIHCTATIEGLNVTAQQIYDYHTKVKKWKRVGYMALILLDGLIHFFTKDDGDQWVDNEEITYGATGLNDIAHHICYVGGIDKDMKPKDTRTQAQEMAMIKFIFEYLSRHPDVKIAGHYHFAPKACPSFDVEAWLELIGVPETNIYRLAA